MLRALWNFLKWLFIGKEERGPKRPGKGFRRRGYGRPRRYFGRSSWKPRRYLESELAKTKDELEKVRRELEEVRKELKELEETRRELEVTKKELEETRRELEETKRKLEEAEKRISFLEGMLDIAKEEPGDLYTVTIVAMHAHYTFEVFLKEEDKDILKELNERLREDNGEMYKYWVLSFRSSSKTIDNRRFELDRMKADKVIKYLVEKYLSQGGKLDNNAKHVLSIAESVIKGASGWGQITVKKVNEKKEGKDGNTG